MTDFLNARRVADEKIYLAEEKNLKPKKIFIDIVDYIQQQTDGHPFRLLDVGCAAGDFFAYLKTHVDNATLTGVDISEKLTAATAKRFPEASIIQADVASSDGLPVSSMDFVTISGVLNCLDNPEQAINNLISATSSGGTVIVWDIFNPFPIDVVVRHRRTNASTPGQWETGWNNFSQSYISQILKNNSRVRDFNFERFSLDETLPRRDDDPMRTWTVEHDGDPYQMMNGMCQLVHQYFLFIRVT